MDVNALAEEIAKLQVQMGLLLEAQKASNLLAIVNSNRPEITEEMRVNALNRAIFMMDPYTQKDYSNGVKEPENNGLFIK